jgi:hypothetical protein
MISDDEQILISHFHLHHELIVLLQPINGNRKTIACADQTNDIPTAHCATECFQRKGVVHLDDK